MKPSIFLGLIASLALTFVPQITANAEEASVCVICNEPAKVYQCNYSNLTTTANVKTINIKGVHFSCIREIAEYGSHGQCAAARNVNNNCNGEPYQLKSLPAVTIKQPEKEDTDGTALKEEDTQPQKQPTLVETTEETYKQTTKQIKEGVEKTTTTVKKGYDQTTETVKSIGNSIGDAATGTYNCVISLFQNCGN